MQNIDIARDVIFACRTWVKEAGDMKIKYSPLNKFANINPEGITQGYPHQTIEYIDISSVGSGHLVTGPEEILLKDAPSRAKRIIRDKDIILATVRPNLRSFLFIKKPNNNAVVSTGFAVLRAKETADPRFIYYCITDEKFTGYLTNNTKGTSYPAVDSNIIVRGQIPDFELKTQQKIASILSTYDDLIDINRRRIQLLEEAARLLFREWFVYFRFPPSTKLRAVLRLRSGQAGHEKVKIVDGVPEGWRRIKFKDIISTIESGGRPKGGAIDEGIPSIGAENVNGIGKHDYSSEKYVPEEYYQNMKKGKIISKDVLLYKDGANIGRVTIVGYGFPHNKCCVNEHVFILRTKNNIQNWLYFFLSQDFIQQAVANLNSNCAQPGISQDKLSSLKIVFPDDKIVKLFDDTAEDIVRQIFALSLQNQKLAQARDLLLPRLMSGRIEV